MHEQLLQQRQQFDGDDAGFMAYANEQSVSYAETWIRYTTIANQFGTETAEAMYVLLAGTPGRAAAFINPGFDVASAITRETMRQIAAAIPEAAPVVAWCLEQGKILTRRCQAWGVEEVTQDMLDAARREQQIRKASEACEAARYAGQVQADADPVDRAATRAALVAGFDVAWPEVQA